MQCDKIKANGIRSKTASGQTFCSQQFAVNHVRELTEENKPYGRHSMCGCGQLDVINVTSKNDRKHLDLFIRANIAERKSVESKNKYTRVSTLYEMSIKNVQNIRIKLKASNARVSELELRVVPV